MRKFWALWAAEMLSMTGTGLTAFALGAWVYIKTGKTTDFALLSVASILPGIALLPLGGALADLWPRRRVMALCNLVAGGCTAALMAMLLTDQLSLWGLYVLLAVGALCRALQWVTFTATMTQLVPARHLGRMSGLIYMGEAGQRLVAPAVGALFLPIIGAAGLLGADLATFIFALVVLALITLPRLDIHDTSVAPHREPVMQVMAQGWRFIRERPGLMALQVFFAFSQFLGGFLPILTLPALMELTGSARVTGLTMAVAGLGLFVGAGMLGLRPLKGSRVRATLLCDGAASASLIAMVLGTHRFGAIWVGLCGFAFSMFHALESGISQELWQRKVPAPLQGRVFAIRRTISWSLVPVCYVLAGPLVDDLFTAWFEPGQPLAQALGAWLGVGRLGAILGLLALAALLRLGVLLPLAWRTRALRQLETRLPDAVEAQSWQSSVSDEA